ncbi:VCBS repeat-containing protein, partial [bacterium]|nr:VCBS repeat-containing protein [bacterium]
LRLNVSADMGIALGDYNSDGHLDVYIAYYYGSDYLFANNGDGTFSDVTESAGLGVIDSSLSATWGDFNNDGFLDLYVAVKKGFNRLFKNTGDGYFEDIAGSAGVTAQYLNSYIGIWGDYNNDGFVDLYVVNFESGESNILFRNNGNETFTDVTSEAGVEGGPYQKSRSAAWGDFNNDGYLDLFVNNQGSDFLYRNNGDGTFTDVTYSAGIEDLGNGSGCAWGDYDNDGFLDLFITNKDGRNGLYRNNGDETFTDVTSSAGVLVTGGSTCCSWADFDNDGDLDIYVSFVAGGNEYLFSNNDDGTFTNIISESGVTSGIGGHAAAWGDYDNDGDLDMFVTSLISKQVYVFKNHVGNSRNWLHIQPVGLVSNEAGIGTRVKVVAGEKAQIRVVNGGESYISQHSLPLEFGLGSITSVDSIIVHWPSGVVQDTADVPANQVLIMKEPLPQHDVALESIMVPEDTVSLAELSPEVRIMNRGSSVEKGFPVTCEIAVFGTTIYSDTQIVDSLASLQSQNIVFKKWTPEEAGLYYFTFYCQVPGDLNSSNDSLSIRVQVIAFVTFTDVTEISGVGSRGNNHGIAFGDYDNDGDLDIYVTKGNYESNILYQNNGDGTFTDVTYIAGVGDFGYGYHSVFGDYDNDGDLDLYIANANMPNVLYQNNGDGTFTDVTTFAGVGDAGYSRSVVFADLNNDGYLDIYVAKAANQANILYRNNRDGTFSDVSNVAGVADQSYSASVVCGDYNNDGFLDIYIANFRGEANVLYRNNGDGTFTNVTKIAGVGDSGWGHSAAFGDYDNDGFLDIYVVNCKEHPNVLYHNNGDGTFTDVTEAAGVGNIQYGRGVTFADFNNDGNLDIYVSNSGRNVFYSNNGDGTFSDLSSESGLDNWGEGVSVSTGDYNNDGWLDIYLGNWKDKPNILFQNNGNSNNWIVVKTIGTVSNRDGIGARVKVVTSESSQYREVSGGSGYCTQNSLPVEFGLGKSTLVDSIIIRWPSGIIQDTTNIAANQIITFVEPLFDHDISVVKIIQPTSIITADTLRPIVLIKNNSHRQEHDFGISCKIDSSGQTIFRETRQIESLSSLDTMRVTFSLWKPEKGGVYTVSFFSELDTDQNNMNDTLWIQVRSLYTHDMCLKRVVTPDTLILHDSFVPIAVIQNLGSTEEQYFDVVCKINDSQGIQVYKWTQTIVHLASLDSCLICFDPWVPTEIGIYEVSYYTQLAGDQNTLNDTLKSETLVLEQFDVDKGKAVFVPQSFSLGQNYPNPFNATTEIRFGLPRVSRVIIKVYNLLGDEVCTLVNEEKDAGFYSIYWNGKDDMGREVASGIYIYVMKAGDFVESKKTLLLK